MEELPCSSPGGVPVARDNSGVVLSRKSALARRYSASDEYDPRLGEMLLSEGCSSSPSSGTHGHVLGQHPDQHPHADAIPPMNKQSRAHRPRSVGIKRESNDP